MSDSSLVLPLHDTTGRIIDLLLSLTSILKNNFTHAYVGVSPDTQKQQGDKINELQKNGFYTLNSNPDNSSVGLHHLNVYQNAISHVAPSHLLHLCTPDRLAFAMTYYPNDFLASINTDYTCPVLFTRSEKAWSTHPSHYRQIENLATTLGEILFHKNLDFCWCHLGITAGTLSEIVPTDPGVNMNIYANLIVRLKDRLKQIPVDWLSWEDPFIMQIEPSTYKLQTESSLSDPIKRLNYVIPILELIRNFYSDQRAVASHTAGTEKN